jgi:hypothetical protein
LAGVYQLVAGIKIEQVERRSGEMLHNSDVSVSGYNKKKSLLVSDIDKITALEMLNVGKFSNSYIAH